jgi:hypothetical protein
MKSPPKRGLFLSEANAMKRLLSVVLCVGIVLGLLPGMLVTPTKATSTETPKEDGEIMEEMNMRLELDGDSMGYCPVCGKTVK